MSPPHPFFLTTQVGARRRGTSATAAGNDVGTDWCNSSNANVRATVPANNYGTPGAADFSCP